MQSRRVISAIAFVAATTLSGVVLAQKSDLEAPSSQPTDERLQKPLSESAHKLWESVVAGIRARYGVGEGDPLAVALDEVEEQIEKLEEARGR